jgi:hypothetical protein
MTVRKLERREWRPYLDRVSNGLVGKRAEIEVASLALGSQILAEWLALSGITYDPKDDIVEIALDGVDHLINGPQEIYVDEGPLGVASVEIIDAAGVRQIVKLRNPLMLPAPAAAAH